MPGRRLLRSIVLVAAVSAGVAAAGCAAPAPTVKVTAQPVHELDLVLLVEIHNPTSSTLTLSELDYELQRANQPSRTRGRVALRASIGPGRTTIVDIHVPLTAAAEPGEVLDVSGRIHGTAGDLALSWPVKAAPRVK
jgi:LEA14-like dessication related protein